MKAARFKPQTRLRRFIGDGSAMAAAYGGGRAYVALQERGAPEFPLDGALGIVARFLGTMGWLGPVSDPAREVGGGLADGAMGRVAAFHQLGIKRDAGSGRFVIQEKE